MTVRLLVTLFIVPCLFCAAVEEWQWTQQVMG